MGSYTETISLIYEYDFLLFPTLFLMDFLLQYCISSQKVLYNIMLSVTVSYLTEEEGNEKCLNKINR